MKADEYMKYFNEIEMPRTNYELEEFGKIFNNKVIKKLFEEVQEISKQRNIKSDSAFKSVIIEINNKSNAIAKRIEKKYGEKIIVKDSFLATLEQVSPEIYRDLF